MPKIKAETAQFDGAQLPENPWWFSFIEPFVKSRYRKYLASLPIEGALKILESVHVPPLYRLGLGLKWGIIDPGKSGFSLSEFNIIVEALQESGDIKSKSATSSRLLRLIESRTVFQIWKSQSRKLLSLRS